jgi:hypothetical protein
MLLGHGFPSTFILAGSLLAIPVNVCGEPNSAKERVRIRYDVPSACPAQSFFEGRVQTRLQGEWLASTSELARLLRVSAIPHGAMWYASLDFEDQTGRSVTRTVKGATCEEAVAAIALVTALAIESPGSEVSESRTGATESFVTGATVSAESAPGQTPAGPGQGKLSDSTRGQSSQATVHRPFSYEIGGSYLRTKGIGPRYANGAELFFGFSPDPTNSLIRVGFSLFDSGEDPTDISRVDARVRTVATRVQSCPLRLDFGNPISLPVCGGVELGLLHVRGSGDVPALVKGQTDQVFWLVPSLSLRLRGDIRALFVEVGPELRLFLTQRQFSVRYGDSLVQAFETPWCSLGLVATAGLHF